MSILNIWKTSAASTVDSTQLVCENVDQIINAKYQLRSLKGKLYTGRTPLAEKSYTYDFLYPNIASETAQLIEKTTIDYFNFIYGKLLDPTPRDKDVKLITQCVYRHHLLSEKLKLINEQFLKSTKGTTEPLNLEHLIVISHQNDKILVEKYLEQYKDSVLYPDLQISSDLIIKRDETLAASTLQKYVETYSSDLNVQSVTELIKEGEALFEAIINDRKSELSPNSQEAQLQLAQLTWFFMKCGINKSEGYYEGSFMIEDPENKIFNFLNSNGHAYERKSSHLKGRSSEAHYGIDVFNQKMPAHKRTLLFARTTTLANQNILFLKPENFSADLNQVADSIMHAKEFIVAQSNKVFYPGSDDLPSMRKERIPVNIIKNFEPIASYIEKNNEEPNPKLRENIKIWGIAHMYREAENVREKLPFDDAQEKLKIFINYVKLTHFLKDFQSKISLKNERVLSVINTLASSEDPIQLITNATIKLNDLFEMLLEQVKLPSGLQNNRLNQIINEMKGVHISDEKMTLPSEEIFISLVNFYASLEAMDHLKDRTGREVYLSLEELVTDREL